MAYIIERVGWSQWLDEGGCWRKMRDVAREFATFEEADEKRIAYMSNSDFEEDDIAVVEA